MGTGDREMESQAVKKLKGGFIKPSTGNLVEAVWGGDRIQMLKGLSPTGRRIGESWECSTHPNHSSTVVLPDGKNVSLAEILEFAGEEVLGMEVCKEFSSKLPVLVKFLDARENLSVQVHPSDEKAAELGEKDTGKTEAWLILDADPGAFLYLGFKDDVNKETFENDLSSKEINIADKYLNAIPAKGGDMFFIPAGTIHSIGKGVFLTEIQQSSGITYRVWDWNRQPKRELHITQALRCLHFGKTEKGDFQFAPSRISANEERLIHSNYFSVDRVTLGKSERLESVTGGRFQILTCLEGEIDLSAQSSKETLLQGESVLVPACLERYELFAKTSSVLLKSFLHP